jgi:hypothetical protein
VDGLTAAHVEEVVGVSGFLDDLRTCLKNGSFRPLPVRERKIPKPGGSGKLRALATQIRAQPSSRSLSSSAYGDASPWSTLPSSTMALQVPQVPWVQAWGSQMPSRRHASSTVWSSRQVISVPSGSTRTVCLVVAAHLLVVCDRWFTGPGPPRSG